MTMTTPKRQRRNPTPTHPIDWQQANRFLNHIHGTHETEIRLIKQGRPTIHKWGDLNDITNPNHPALQNLQRLNTDGYGVYAVINHPNPTTATKIKAGTGATNDDDITEATALFVDVDREEDEPGANLHMLEDAEVPPSLIVQSSAPNKIHAYWLVDDLLDINLWRRLQTQLIAHFAADPVCRNPSRIMRIPGFWHHKQTPIQTRLLTSPGTIYSTAELVELFDLDPELQIEEAPPTEAPAGYHPPAVQLLLDRPFTRRVAHKVKTSDKGRHHAVLWWAQHLRENHIPEPEALATAPAFASMLPARHIEGPIPPEEVTEAIKWAYAKLAGRNQPVRQTGLETVAVGGQGRDGQGNQGHDGEDLDDFTARASHAPITIQNGGYARVKDTREGPTFTQLTNFTFTPQLALQWPDGSTGHRGTLAINTTTTHTIDIPAKAWASRRDLLTTISAYDAVIFANSNSDVAHIRQFILTWHPGLPTATGVTTYGLHKINGTWEQLYEDTHHERIFYVGTPVDPGPAYRTLTPGTPEEIEQARNTIRALPDLITPTAALALLGYAMASAYAPRITPSLGDRLPFLYITGERESGKSSSIELVLALTTGHPSARLRKAPGLTPYQYDTAYANLNNRLAALDEYRPGSIDDAQLRKHHDLGTKWRGTGIAAKDHAYTLNTPLIVAGEGFTEDAAALSRGPLYFINKRDRGNVDTYLSAQTAPNHAYAKHLADTAANLPEDKHQQRLQEALQLAKDATEAKGGPRLQFALTWIAYGLLHLQNDGIDLITTSIIRSTLEAGVLQTLDGGDESKTNLETFLEQLGFATMELKDPWGIVTPGIVDTTIIIRISPAVELVRSKYGKDAAISNARLLRQYAEQLDWVDAGAVHKAIGNIATRGIKVELRRAPERCDLSALEHLERKLRYDA